MIQTQFYWGMIGKLPVYNTTLPDFLGNFFITFSILQIEVCARPVCFTTMSVVPTTVTVTKVICVYRDGQNHCLWNYRTQLAHLRLNAFARSGLLMQRNCKWIQQVTDIRWSHHVPIYTAMSTDNQYRVTLGAQPRAHNFTHKLHIVCES